MFGLTIELTSSLFTRKSRTIPLSISASTVRLRARLQDSAPAAHYTVETVLVYVNIRCLLFINLWIKNSLSTIVVFNLSPISILIRRRVSLTTPFFPSHRLSMWLLGLTVQTSLTFYISIYYTYMDTDKALALGF